MPEIKEHLTKNKLDELSDTLSLHNKCVDYLQYIREHGFNPTIEMPGFGIKHRMTVSMDPDSEYYNPKFYDEIIIHIYKTAIRSGTTLKEYGFPKIECLVPTIDDLLIYDRPRPDHLDTGDVRSVRKKLHDPLIVGGLE